LFFGGAIPIALIAIGGVNPVNTGFAPAFCGMKKRKTYLPAGR